MSEREPRRPQRGHGPHGMQAPVEKSKDFTGSLKRLIAQLRPDGWLVSLALVGAALSVGLNVAAPKILGKATDLLFNGVISKMIADAPSKEIGRAHV